MNNKEKRIAIQKLIDHPGKNEKIYYDLLSQIEGIKRDYGDYMTTSPINCDKELETLNESSFDRCLALLTMILREDHFCCGSLIKRIENGQVNAILERLNEYLK